MQRKEWSQKRGGRGRERERQKGKKDLLREQAQACTIQPLRMKRTHTARGNTGALKTAISSTKNGNADAI